MGTLGIILIVPFFLSAAFCQYMGDTSGGQNAGAAGGSVPAPSSAGASPSGPVSIGQQPYVDPSKVQPGYFVPLEHSVNAQPTTGFNNTATCTFGKSMDLGDPHLLTNLTSDQKCFKYSEGCTFTNCRPFNRSSPVTCEECMNLCLSKQNTTGPYCCKSMVYDVQYRICDLFSQDIGGNLANLAKRPGHIYFQSVLPVLAFPTLQPLGAFQADWALPSRHAGACSR